MESDYKLKEEQERKFVSKKVQIFDLVELTENIKEFEIKIPVTTKKILSAQIEIYFKDEDKSKRRQIQLKHKEMGAVCTIVGV